MLWIAGGVALFPVGAAIDDETMNDTESLLPTGSESVSQWRETAALARHPTKVPHVYSEGVRTPFEKWRPQDSAAERPHEAGRHR